MPSPDLVVYGATGMIGRRVCAELDAAGAAFAIAGRRAEAIDALGRQFPAAERRVASLDALDSAMADARVVINCAGPLAHTGEPVLVAALAAGAHYVDLGGAQDYVLTTYERHESTARHAGRTCVPACAVAGAIGDSAATWAAQHVCGIVDGGETIRTAPAPRLADASPLDEVAVSYVLDDVVLAPSTQRALFGALHGGVEWRRDRWEPVATGAHRRRVNAGPAGGGEREVTSFPGDEVITLPRHIAAHAIRTYVSTTRRAAAQTALRWLARAMPLVPRRATELLAPYAPDEADYARTRFAVVAQARRGFAAAQVVVHGTDLYRTSAAVAAWIARQLVARGSGPLGMRAASELFCPAPALRELATIADLVVEPSFGDHGINDP